MPTPTDLARLLLDARLAPMPPRPDLIARPRLLARLDASGLAQPAQPAEVRVMLGAAPAQGTPTLCRSIGDALAWACVAGLATLTALAFVRRRARGLLPATA